MSPITGGRVVNSFRELGCEGVSKAARQERLEGPPLKALGKRHFAFLLCLVRDVEDRLPGKKCCISDRRDTL